MTHEQKVDDIASPRVTSRRERLFAGASLYAGISLLALLPATAAAQDEETPLRLDALEISGTAPALTQPDVEAARERVRRTPGAATVIDAEEFRDRRAVTPKDMLGDVPGIFVQTNYGEDSRLNIRGSGASLNFHVRGTRLMQDGVPFNLADGFGDFQQIDPLAFNHVEVFRGASALEHGSTAPGGAINFISPTGRTAPGVTARSEVGSFDFGRVQASVGGVEGAWDYFMTGSFLDQDGFRDQSEQESIRFNANVARQIANNAETRFFATYNTIDQQVPGSLSRADALDDPEQAVPINVANDWQRNIDSFRLSNKTTVLLGDSTEVSFGGFFVDKELDHPIFRVIDDQSQDYGGFARLDNEGTLFGHRNEIRLGSNLHAGTNDSRQFVNVGGARGELVRDLRQRAFNIEFFGENHFYLRPHLALVLGGQVAHAIRDTKDRMPGDASFDNRNTFTFFSPKAGVIWDVEPDWQIFSNVSRSTEVPTFISLNPTAAEGVSDVDETRLTTVELGSRGDIGRLRWDAAVFRSWVNDEIQLFSLGDGRTVSQNADDTIHQGIELGFTAEAARGLFFDHDRVTVQNTYTFNDFRFDGDPTFGDNRLPGLPRHVLRAELQYHHASGLSFGPNVEWVPQAPFSDNANTVRSDSYAILGFAARYDVTPGVRIFLDARNLTDEAFISHTDVAAVATPEDRLFNPGPTRAINFGIELRW